MQVLQQLLASLFAGIVLFAAGCSWLEREPTDPFAAAKPKTGEDGVVQASYEQPARQVVSAEGQSDEPTGWDRFSAENLKKSFKKAIGKGPSEQIARQRYQEGDELFAKKEYADAAKKFGEAADRWPDSSLEENAMFLQAESLFFADKYSKACDVYGELMKKYVNTRHIVHMLREIMRMEMPDRWTDVLDGPVTGIRRPAVNQTYLRKISAANNGAGVTNGDGFQGAECLYMIITFGLDDADAITNFSQSDVGDSDNDGLPEFLDGWGRPISFIRWPAGFTSALQTRAVDEPDPASPTKDFDQFNPRRINDLPNGVPSSRAPPSKKHPRRFVLYPLVYSGGPDRKYDLAIGAAPFSYSFKVGMVGYVDPYLYIPSPQGKFQVGAPEDLDGDGSLDNGDNIHNHDLTVR
jgi:hypothetical protein